MTIADPTDGPGRVMKQTTFKRKVASDEDVLRQMAGFDTDYREGFSTLAL